MKSNIIRNKYDEIVENSFQRMPFHSSQLSEENAENNRQECQLRPLIVKSNPVRVRLELSNACNLKCKFCYRSHFTSNNKSLLTADDIDAISPILKTAKFISLSQKAEPLTSPFIIPILDKMSRYNSIFSLYTNGQLLNQNIATALIRNKINFLTISICSFDEDNYRRLFRGGKLETVIRNIEKINLLKKKKNSIYPRLRMSFILRKDTVKYLDEALNFAHKNNFNEGIQVLLFFRSVDTDRKFEPISNWNFYQNKLEEFKNKAAKKNVQIDFSFTMPDEKKIDQYSCYEPWETFNINSNGDVSPCGLGVNVVGNIHNDDPLTIWNNNSYVSFRSGMNSQNLNSECENCWHCRYVSPFIVGDRLVKLDKVFNDYVRISKK